MAIVISATNTRPEVLRQRGLGASAPGRCFPSVARHFRTRGMTAPGSEAAARRRKSFIPYENLINLYLRDCAQSDRKLSMKWE